MTGCQHGLVSEAEIQNLCAPLRSLRLCVSLVGFDVGESSSFSLGFTGFEDEDENEEELPFPVLESSAITL